MPPNLDHQFRPRMTLRQLGLLVVYAAIATGVMVPEVRRGSGPSRLVTVALLEIPMALVPTTLILMRRGPLKFWSLAFLCALPFVALLHYFNTPTLRQAMVGGWWSIHPRYLTFLAFFDVAMVVILSLLVRLLVPVRCPSCGRPTMLRDPSIPHSFHFSTPSEGRLCLGCGARFRRARRGPWVDVDTLPNRSVPAGLEELLAPILARKSNQP